MKPTTTLLIGAPLSGDEAHFLRTLCEDLDGAEALVLANFDTKRQIDFVVVTPSYAALLELKNFRRPIFGQQNGDWKYENPAGTRDWHSGENPWQQAKNAKFALSDEMLKFQKRHTDVPLPAGRGYFTQFNAFVCIYPKIHPESQVTSGDYKVKVASYREVINAIKAGSIYSTWSLDDWRRFAQQHLSLTEATLEEATNPIVNAAAENVRAYRARIAVVIGTALPPLLSDSEQTDYGQALVESMLEPWNFLLIGPSGSTKTFHLHHLALAISAKGEELPFLLEAKRYRGGDFWPLLRHATAPLFRGDPKALLDAMPHCGQRAVLMLDALNECSAANLPDLLRGMQTFALQYEARVIITSQTRIELPGDIESNVKQLALPDSLQKRSIYAYHAGLSPTSDLDDFCLGFTNAYDLTIAGRCHNSAVGPESRVDLYDRYVRRCLPEHTALMSVLLRTVAGEMATTISSVWGRDLFERVAERFLSEQHAPLAILDELRRSRLIQLTDDCFSFEHELLFDYFKAEHLRRVSSDIGALAQELRKPRNHGLLELIVSRFTDVTDLATILSAAEEATTLCRVLVDKCGSEARSVLLRECEALLDAAAEDLPNIEVTCESVPIENGRRRLTDLNIAGARQWTAHEALLFHAIALNLDHPRLQNRFLDLLDATERTLRAAVLKAAKSAKYEAAAVWGEAVRLYGGLLHQGTLHIPCVSMLTTIRSVQMYPRHYKRGLPIRAELFERVDRTTESHFSMLALFEDLRHRDDSADVQRYLGLVQQGWDSGIYILRIGALELLQSMVSQVEETCPGELPRILEMLNSFDSDDISVNTLTLEVLASYGGLELPVSPESALSEMKAVIAPNIITEESLVQLAAVCEVSPAELLAGQAYGCLSKIFEDIFQGAYDEAYSQLSDEEKCDILCLAARAPTQGFHTDWIIRELFKCGGRRALPVYAHFASMLDTDAFSVQESVAVFELGIAGYARFSERPAPYHGGNSSEHLAWQTIGEILFWCCRADAGDGNSERIRELWARVEGPVGLAAADVLYQLAHSLWRLGDRDRAVDLVTRFADNVRPILEHCLVHRDSLPTIFRHGGSGDRSMTPFLIGELSRVGDATTIPILQGFVDDTEHGKDVIQAIESIQKRIMPRAALRSL